jgi:hypothetical protein
MSVPTGGEEEGCKLAPVNLVTDADAGRWTAGLYPVPGTSSSFTVQYRVPGSVYCINWAVPLCPFSVQVMYPVTVL